MSEPVDKQISELPAASALGDNDLLVIQQGNNAKKASGSALKTFLNSGKVSSTVVTTLWEGTEDAYDAIATKDPNTLYFIEEE